MPATVPVIQTNQFSPNSNNLNQTFFNAAFAGRLSQNPVYKETYWCKFIGEIGLGTFLDEYTGYDTFCFPNYSVVEYDPFKDQIKTTAAPVVVTAYPAYTTIPLDAAYSQFYSTWILPTVGQTIVAPPYGALLEVTAVTAQGVTPSITVRNRSTSGATFTIPAGSLLKVLTGKYMADCDCPTGPFRVPDLPIVTPISMKKIGQGSGLLCGDALLACQNLKLPFYDADGNATDVWYNGPLTQMYKDFEKMKQYTRLLDPDWGLIPVLVARGSIFTTAYATSVTEDDIYAWGTALTTAGVTCTDYAIACGRDLFVMFQRLFNSLSALNNGIIGIFESNDDCKWLNLNWCRMSIGGLNLHIFEDKWMSNGLGLGAAGYNFRKAGIMIPLCDRASNFRSDESASKMLTTVYFKDNLGRVWDNLQDGNGVYGPRNTFGTGCDNQEWTVKTEFSQIVHCPQAWGLINFL